jgi:predicted transposase YbfD/YdcC
MARVGVVAIRARFANLTDPRVDRTKRHLLLDMVAIALCGAICGANSWADVERFGKAKLNWLRQFLDLEEGIPSHDTFSRVFARLDTNEFLTCLHNWLRSFKLALKEKHVAIDGKTLRGSFDRARGKSPLHLVSAWASDLRISLGQVAVDEKSNEITAVPQLLELLELTGAVVTLDAMHCQKETTAVIQGKGADYLITVKENQPKLHAAIADLFLGWGESDYKVAGVKVYKKSERSHGRNETRVYYVAAPPPELRASLEWIGVRTIGMVYRCREIGDKTQEEVSYFISSLPPAVKRIAHLVRAHWGIENTLHWSLDVTFGEDQSRIRKGQGPELAAVFRRLALMVLQQDTSTKSSIRGKRLMAGWNTDILEKILTSFQGN